MIVRAGDQSHCLVRARRHRNGVPVRLIRVDTVVLTDAAARLAGQPALDAARDAGLPLLVDGPAADCGQDSAGESPVTGITVGVGVTQDDVALRETVDVYFHTGAIADLTDKRGVSVPLIDQRAAGVRNVLRWAAATHTAPQNLADHGDVAAHAEHCAAQYRSDGHVMKAERLSIEAAHAIVDAFPQVCAVLGTGFPFYCMTGIDAPGRAGVPPSIRTYTATQAEHFGRKLLPLRILSDDRRHTREELEGHGVDLGQTRFNAYEYTRWGVAPPVPPAEGTADDYVRANTADISSRDWPCHLCTHLADAGKFPEQTWQRDFMPSCLRCGQTPFLPRAVGVLGSDIDLIALVDDTGQDGAGTVDPASLAHEIAEWIDAHPRYFRHDTRWPAQLGGEHGPLDVFVAGRSAFVDAADRIATGDSWMDVTVGATVTWLPVTDIEYEVGKYLPLCMELLLDRTGSRETMPGPFTADLTAARRRFATAVTLEEVLASYRADSEYLQQLAGNDSVVATLHERYVLWREAAGEPTTTRQQS